MPSAPRWKFSPVCNPRKSSLSGIKAPEKVLKSRQGKACVTSSVTREADAVHRNLSFSYPGSHSPALRNVSFTLEAGERLAIVGCNGSGASRSPTDRCSQNAHTPPRAGKSTLANIILRISSFDGGELLVNGRDIRRYSPPEYHEHVTAVFQGFSRFEGSVRLNVGVGYVPDMRSHAHVDAAVTLAGAKKLVSGLPNGLKTSLDASGCSPVARPLADAFACGPERRQHGLSGGEVSWSDVVVNEF